MFSSTCRAIVTLTILGTFSLHVFGFALESSNQQDSLVDMSDQESGENGFSSWFEFIAPLSELLNQFLAASPAQTEAPAEFAEESAPMQEGGYGTGFDGAESEDESEDESESEDIGGFGFGFGFGGGGGAGGIGGSGVGGGMYWGLVGLAGIAGLDDSGPDRVSM